MHFTEDTVSDQHVPDLSEKQDKVAEPANLAEFLADHIGVLGNEEDPPAMTDLSKDAGRRFSKHLLERWKAGRL
jgi:hypothetical protein